MWKIAIVALFITSPAFADSFTKYCPTDPDPNYGEYLIRIPMGIAHFTETWPRYCHVHHETGESLCMSTLSSPGDVVRAGPVFQVRIEADSPHIIMGNRMFVPCRD